MPHSATTNRKASSGPLRLQYLRFASNRYELAPVSRRWLLKNQPTSLHSAILHRELDLRFMKFDTYLRTGRPNGFHDNLKPSDWRLYQQGQASHAAALLVDEVVSGAPLSEEARNLLDLGGAHGLYSLAFCNRYPQLRALVVDLASPPTAFESPWIAKTPQDRIEFQQADILTVDLP
jgi:hypothetical protein